MGWRALAYGATTTTGAMALYLGTHDPDGHLKFLVSSGSPVGAPEEVSGALLRAVHVPASQLDSSAANWSLEYPVVLATAEGGWWDAAQIYREWALTRSSWAVTGTLEDQIKVFQTLTLTLLP
jgi:hypothetical protein